VTKGAIDTVVVIQHTSCVQVRMVGRTAERAAMAAAYARAVAGISQVVLVTGEAGIGKTRLADDLIEGLRSDPHRPLVLAGESAPLAGAALAYGPFVAALGDHAPWLLADDNTGDVLTARHRLFVRVLGALTGLAARQPVALVLEDLHWADESSRALLALLVVRLRDEPVLIVGTLRESELDDDVRRWLAEIESRPRVTRLRLERMADADIAGIAAEVLPADSGAEHLAAIVAAAEGNPLYARELALADPAAGPPASIAEAILAKAGNLAPPARAIADQVCVADGGMAHDLLAATVTQPEEQLLPSVRQAVASGLLVAAGDGYACPHALIRQVLYGALLEGERRRLHRRLAEALARRADASPGSLAQHWHLAGCPDLAAAAAVEAARQAASARAYPEALRNYTLALGLRAWLADYGSDLLADAAQTASWAGDPLQAVQWAAEALAMTDAPQRARLLERLGRYRWESGDLMAAVEAAEQAAALTAGEPPSVLRAAILAEYATLRMLLGESDAALSMATEAVAVAEQAGALAEQAHGLATLGIVQAQGGELDSGLASLRRSFELARQAASAEHIVRAAANHMYLLCTRGRFAEALAVARSGRQAARLLGTPTALTSVLDNNTAAVLISTGRWQEADELLSELAGLASGNAARYLQQQRLELAVGRAEWGLAADLAAALGKSTEDPRLLGPMHACLAEAALGQNDPASAAWEILSGLAAIEGADLPGDEIRLLSIGARIHADLALLPEPVRPDSVAAGWAEATGTFAARAAAITEASDAQPEIAAYGAQTAAEHARSQGADRRAIWRAVGQAWHVADQPHREAYARLREAEATVRAGRRDQAARVLAACEALAGPLPAETVIALARELGRRARLPVGAQPPGPAAASSRYDLTGREVEVLARLVHGDSNRQIARALFISDRTAAVHVSRILAKLGVRNRTQAATVGAQMGLTPATSRSQLTSNEEDGHD
jgi:DNA-binding CsgD family transcriptional regulator